MHKALLKTLQYHIKSFWQFLECDDWNERNHSLHVSVEMFRREVPRLLTKITHISHPVPNRDQLADAIRKLDDELGKMIKQIAALLLKDSTAEDVAVASQQSIQTGKV